MLITVRLYLCDERPIPALVSTAEGSVQARTVLLLLFSVLSTVPTAWRPSGPAAMFYR